MTLPTLRLLFPTLLLCFATGDLSAQSLSLFNIDASNFPEVEGRVLALDANGEMMPGLDGSDLIITENGRPVVGTVTVDCPPPAGPTPVSVVLVIDRSGSMVTPLPNGETPLDLIRIGAIAFLETLLFTPPTAVAISGFNQQSFLISDFRNSAPPLIDALQTIVPDGGTHYDPAFLDPISGGIELLRPRPASTRKIIVFISDGEPNQPPSTETIINSANENDITVYTVTIGLNVTPDLRRIASETGGLAYGDVSNSNDLAGVLRSIALVSRGAGPCRVRWQSEVACANDVPMRIVSIAFPSASLGAEGNYTVPKEKLTTLESTDRTIWFGTTVFPNVSQQTFDIIARNGPITVTAAQIGDATHFRILDWGGLPPPFTLEDGERRTITVQFVPTDTTAYAADLIFAGDPCPSGRILLTGGRRSPNADRAPLVLLTPIGGEKFDGCDSVSIRWGGVAPEQPVRIQYSNDGTSWKEIVDSATNFEYRWFPPAPDTNYRIRISTDASEQHIVYTVAGGGDSLADDILGIEASLNSPWGLDVGTDTLYIAEAGGRNQIRQFDLLSNIISTAAGTGSPGNGGDGGDAIRARFSNPIDVLVTDSTIYIADRDNFKIRAVDRRTKIVSTFAGTGAVGFSPDGTRVDTGMIGAPTALATDGTYLYFSEISSVVDTNNHRVRRIDLKTRVISTVAGGGTFYDSDGALATKARLLYPSGIALREGFLYFAERDAARVRRVNLTSGIITTMAGTGRSGSRGDGGFATSAELNSPTDLLFIEDELFIAESTNGNRIRVVDMKSNIISTFAGTGARGFSGDSGAARLAQFSDPSSLAVWGDYLFVSDRGNRRIRAITLRLADGLDSTGTPFAVNAPQLRVGSGIINREINVGEISLTALKDTIVESLICNTGTAPLMLDSVQIVGVHSTDFRVVGGLSNVPIPPGECRTVAIEFEPSAVGERRASAIFYGSCTFPDTVSLSGIGTPGCALEPKERVDFGTVILGTNSGDSLITQTFCNRGNTTISGEVRLVTGSDVFTIVSGGGPFTLAPNQCLNLRLRFTPDVSGLVMGIIDYGIPSECGTAQTLVSGKGVHQQELAVEALALPAAFCPNDPHDTTVILRNLGEEPLEVTAITFLQNDEGFSVLSPLPTSTSPLVIPGGGEEQIAIRFAPASAGTKRARLGFESNDPRGEIEVLLTGGRDSLALWTTTPQVVVPRDSDALYPRDTLIGLRNTGDRPMRVTGAVPSGGDVSFFAVPLAQFPIDIAPGTEQNMIVQILQPTEDRSYRTEIAVAFEPTCDLPSIVVDLLHAGDGPAFAAQPMRFPLLSCDEPSEFDTTIVVTNPGGAELRIDAIEIINDPEGNFSTSLSTPIIIPSGGSAEISVRFNPTATGVKTATLRLTTNTENGLEEIVLTGERGNVAFTLSRNSISFDPATGAPRTMTVELRNVGTVPITWSLSSVNTPYVIVSLLPLTAGPGESSTLTLRYDGSPDGGPDDSLVIGETICGATQVLRIGTDKGAATVDVWLPHDSAFFNTRVHVPLRYRLIDGTEPADIDSFTTTIRFVGTTFFFEGLTGGEVVNRDWNPTTSELSVTIRGSFGDRRGDTLTTLVATALLAEVTHTPLEFRSFAWGRPSITGTAVDGSFSVLGTCLDTGLHLNARPPRVERITPIPASDRVTAEIALDDWAWLRAELIDPSGKAIEVSREQYLEAGRHQLTFDASNLPAGVYLLRVETPQGSAERWMVVVR